MSKQEIDNKAIELYKEKQKDNALNEQNLKMDLFTLCMNYFDDMHDNENYVIDAILESMEKYDYKKGTSFFSFLNTTLSNRKIDAYRKENVYQKNNEKINKSECTVSFDEEYQNKNGKSLNRHETVSDENSLHPENVVIDNENINEAEKNVKMQLSELNAMILNFAQCYKGKGKNQNRRKWFSMFYTEDMTCLLKSEFDLKFFHERDVLNALYHSYLDYYMQTHCDSLYKIQVTPLKLYNEVVLNAKENKNIIKVKKSTGEMYFDSKVSLSYLEMCEGKKF